MGTPKQPKAVKYFVGLLAAERQSLAPVRKELEEIFGPIDGETDLMPWTVSTFYEPEMGSALRRGFASFAALRSPAELAGLKRRTQAIEEKYRSPLSGGRQVNLDPGYVDLFKAVLASTKNASQRIYLDSGIYAEATLFYFAGEFHGLPYSYPDYLWPETLAFMTRLRAGYLEQLRQGR